MNEIEMQELEKVISLNLDELRENLEISLDIIEHDLAETAATIDDLKSEMIQKQINRDLLNERLKAIAKLLACTPIGTSI